MSTTRLLLLGVVRIFQPAYGYQLRRELLTWNVQEWANINPGSIYTGLRTLAKHGYLAELEEGPGHRPGRTSYKLTDEGDTEFFSLLRLHLWTVDGFHPDRMQAALSFLWLLPRYEVLAALDTRIEEIERRLQALPSNEQQIAADPGTPNQVVEMLRITASRERGELAWTREFRDRVTTATTPSTASHRTGHPDPRLIAEWRDRPS